MVFVCFICHVLVWNLALQMNSAAYSLKVIFFKTQLSLFETVLPNTTNFVICKSKILE